MNRRRRKKRDFDENREEEMVEEVKRMDQRKSRDTDLPVV